MPHPSDDGGESRTRTSWSPVFRACHKPVCHGALLPGAVAVRVKILCNTGGNVGLHVLAPAFAQILSKRRFNPAVVQRFKRINAEDNGNRRCITPSEIALRSLGGEYYFLFLVNTNPSVKNIAILSFFRYNLG